MNYETNKLEQNTNKTEKNINSGFNILQRFRNFFTYKTYFEDVAAFANEIDLKTLKADIVPAKIIYSKMWKIIKKSNKECIMQ